MQTSRAPVPPSPASNTPTLDCRSPKNLKCKGASSNELNCAKDGQQAEHNTVFRLEVVTKTRQHLAAR